MNGESNRICKLLDFGLNDGNKFLPTNPFAQDLVQECLALYKRDNICTTIDNSKGNLCSTYPVRLIIPLKQKQCDVPFENDVDKESFKKEVLQSINGRFARTRGRFPAPVLLFHDKIISRSSTLARSPEIYSRSSYDYLMQGEAAARLENEIEGCNGQNGSHEPSLPSTNGHTDEDSAQHTNGQIDQSSNGVHGDETANNKRQTQKLQQTENDSGKSKEWLVDKVRNADIELLKTLKVDMICDLMVENKKVKYGMTVTSSEKVDSENRYRDFGIICIPYPGCEFFADYSLNNYTGAGLKFDWKQTFVDAELQVPDSISQIKGIDWKDYMQWDLIKLTQNYLKLLLNCLVGQCCTGILLHCISGWDRTPLFISILRLSLWADGLIHQSLNAEEIVYLTLAYDWLLFSHQFVDRIARKEEIMHFCFEFLKVITSAEYSVLPYLTNLNTSLSDSSGGTDDLFCIENLTNGHKMPNGEENGCGTGEESIQTDCSFEEVHHARNCNATGSGNGLQNDYAKKSDESLLDLRDVDTCLNCIDTTVANSSYCENCGDEDGSETGESKSLSCDKKDHNSTESVPAVLPLDITDDKERNTPFANGSHGSAPSAALSSSFETAKSIYSTQQSDPPKILQKAMCSSLDLSEDTVKYTPSKSDPITVPLPCQPHHLMDGCVDENSVSSSFSAAVNAAEPGSSWQLVSSPSPQGAESTLGPNYNNRSRQNSDNCSQSSLNQNFSSSPCNGANSSDLKLKLLKRKERLAMAYKVMIPAYSKVVQRQREKLQQESTGLSAMLGSLVGFVKRGWELAQYYY